MLSFFPELLFLSPLSALLIRVALSLVLAYSAKAHIARSDAPSRVLAVFEIGAAILLFVGAWSQPAALISFILAAIWFFQPTSRVVSLGAILLSIVMSLSLLVTGPGAFAFDLPL